MPVSAEHITNPGSSVLGQELLLQPFEVGGGEAVHDACDSAADEDVSGADLFCL